MEDPHIQSYLDELEETQRTNLNHFKEIAGNMETAACIQVLEEHNWDLEAAVNQLMGINPSDSQGAPVASHSEHSDDMEPAAVAMEDADNSVEEESNLSNSQRHVRPQVRHRTLGTSFIEDTQQNNVAMRSTTVIQRPLPPVDVDSPFVQVVTYDQRVSLLDWIKFLISSPILLVYSLFKGILLFFWSLVSPQRHQLTDPVHEVNQFIDYLKTTYGDNREENLPKFYRNTYAEALRRARQELKFLFVYLHGDSHENSDAFCRDVICHPALVQFVSTSSDLVCWACNVQSGEGFRVSQALRTHTYPFMGLIVLHAAPSSFAGNHSQRGAQRMTLVGRIEGYDESLAHEQGVEVYVNELLDKVRAIIRNNEASLVVARVDRDEREVAQRLRAEQDREYQESLRLDRERFEAKEKAKSDAAKLAFEGKRQRELLAKTRAALRNSIPPEVTWEEVDASRKSISLAQISPGAEDADRVKVLVRLPDGLRLHCSYPREASSKLLFLSIFAHENAPENFDVFTNFPKREIPCRLDCLKGPYKEDFPETANRLWFPDCDDPKSFAELGFSKSETVLVNDNDA